MLICSSETNAEKILNIFDDEEVVARNIGSFTDDGLLKLFQNKSVVGQLEVPFLFNSQTRLTRRAAPINKQHYEPKFEVGDLTQDLINILAMPNIASKEKVIRTYDHEVKAQTILNPLQGSNGPGDATVLKPLFDSFKGVVLSNGMNPEYGKIDPYHMAANAIDEAIRNNVCVGGRRIALLDNFCWGNPEKPDRLWSLVRASQACYDVAREFGTPFISGKDSLYNESELGPVTPTLLISALGVIPDVRRAVSMDLKEPGNTVYIIGSTKHELGGSHYYKWKGYVGRNVPVVIASKAKNSFDALTKAIDVGCVRSCHDLSEGGIAVAASEMAFAGDVGLDINLGEIPTSGSLQTDVILFSESPSRFLVEVTDTDEFEGHLKGNVYSKIGRTTDGKKLALNGRAGSVIDVDINTLKRSWQNGL
jgi:phosphoribosylformylglycinamidine synthase